MRAVRVGSTSPVITLNTPNVWSITSLDWEGASEVTRSPKRRAPALEDISTPSLTAKDTDDMG